MEIGNGGLLNGLSNVFKRKKTISFYKLREFRLFVFRRNCSCDRCCLFLSCSVKRTTIIILILSLRTCMATSSRRRRADTSCSHVRAVEYFAESINSETKFYAVKCLSYFLYKWSLCNKYNTSSLIVVGEHVDTTWVHRRQHNSCFVHGRIILTSVVLFTARRVFTISWQTVARRTPWDWTRTGRTHRSRRLCRRTRFQSTATTYPRTDHKHARASRPYENKRQI